MGVGGVWIDHSGAYTGEMVSAGALAITGQDLYATDMIDTDAIRLEGPISAAGTVTLSMARNAPLEAGAFLNTTVRRPPEMCRSTAR